MELLDDQELNKGTAFTEEERRILGLDGLLPPHVETLDEQAARAYEAYKRKDDDLERHIYLRALQDSNEVLFYRLLLDHIEEMTPIVYTPVVAQACQQFSHIYRRPRGLFVSWPARDSIPAILRNRPNPKVDVIVVVPRLLATLLKNQRLPLGLEVWEDTRLQLPDAGRFLNIFSGQILNGSQRELPISEILCEFPVGLLNRTSPSQETR